MDAEVIPGKWYVIKPVKIRRTDGSGELEASLPWEKRIVGRGFDTEEEAEAHKQETDHCVRQA